MFLQKYDDEMCDDRRLADLESLGKKTLADVLDQAVEVNEKGQPAEPPQHASEGVVNKAADISEEPRLDGGTDCQNGDAQPIKADEVDANGEVHIGEVQVTRM